MGLLYSDRVGVGRTKFDWDMPGARDRLAALWSDPANTASDCARTMNLEFAAGLSRAAVLGVVHREGLKRRDPSTVVAAPEARPFPEPPAEGYGLLDLPAGACKYPISPDSARVHRFCGKKARLTGCYCEEHHVVCYNPEFNAAVKARGLRAFV